jgi:hypothetical protein
LKFGAFFSCVLDEKEKKSFGWKKNMYRKFWLVWGIFWSLVAGGAWFVWHQNLEREKLTLCRYQYERKVEMDVLPLAQSTDWVRLVNILAFMASTDATLQITSALDLQNWFFNPQIYIFVTQPFSKIVWNDVVLTNPSPRMFAEIDFSEMAHFLYLYIQNQRCESKTKTYQDTFILACVASSFAGLGFAALGWMHYQKIKTVRD